MTSRGEVTIREMPPAIAPAKVSTKALFSCPDSSVFIRYADQVVFFFVAFVTNYEEEKTKSPDYIEIGEEKEQHKGNPCR
jgi:hypothetical protein